MGNGLMAFGCDYYSCLRVERREEIISSEFLRVGCRWGAVLMESFLLLRDSTIFDFAGIDPQGMPGRTISNDAS